MIRKYTLRTRMKGGLVAEFLAPDKKSNKVIILCAGMPSYPSAKELMFKLASLGYHVFLPRYRGSWESEGTMFSKSPHFDVIDVIDSVSSGFSDLWSGDKYRIARPAVYIVGSSFGGTAAMLSSADKRVRKAVAISPVIDWREESEIEPLDFLESFTRQAFGQGYRFAPDGWKKLKSGRFYNPIAQAGKLDGKKIYIIQSRDDEIVPFRPAVSFSKQTGSKLRLMRKSGHMSLSDISRRRLWPDIERFFLSR